jgi:glucan 1,3-beta-glucosidase
MSTGAPTDQSVGSVTFIDSFINNTQIGFITGHAKNGTSQPPAAGSLILENVSLNDVPLAIQGLYGVTSLEGTTGSTVITGWGQGHAFTPNGSTSFEGGITPNSRPSSLVQGDGKYYERS